MEKNCEQETFAGPSLAIAAMHVSASRRSDTSLALLKPLVFPDLGIQSKISFMNRL